MSIHSSASIHPTAIIGAGVVIGANAIVCEGASIGDNCEIMANAYVGPRTRMGTGNRVHFNAIVGHEPQVTGWDRNKIRSGTVIGNDNEFREFSTVHRAMYDAQDTVIGNNCSLMAYAHVAHDCKLGNRITMVNYGALSGHVTVEDGAFISGLVGIHQFCRIGRLAMVGGHSGITQDVPPFMMTKGSIGFLCGVNVVGMRRAGVKTTSRTAIRNAYKTLFREGRSIPNGIAKIRAEAEDKGEALAEELAQLLAFIETKTKRGILTGRSLEQTLHTKADDMGE